MTKDIGEKNLLEGSLYCTQNKRQQCYPISYELTNIRNTANMRSRVIRMVIVTWELKDFTANCMRKDQYYPGLYGLQIYKTEME